MWTGGVEDMKYLFGVCLVAFLLMGVAVAQQPALHKGVSVKMAVATNPVEMRAADRADATVVGVTRDGAVFLGAQKVETNALSNLKRDTVYVKADARATYQDVLTVLETLRGRPIVLLTA